MGRMLIAHPTILQGQSPIFEGSGQYERFNKMFHDIVDSDEHRQAFVEFGITPEYFGTHSIRKGAVTFVATGSTSCPPIASICIRANWAMPGVMNRYIKYESAGDQFVAKCVSGRSRMTKEFAASPPYFDFSEMDPTTKATHKNEVTKWIKSRMPEGARSNDNVFSLFYACIASIGYHKEFLLKRGS